MNIMALMTGMVIHTYVHVNNFCYCKFTKHHVHRCWISEENGAIWAFIGPMLLIILVIMYNVVCIIM